MKSARLIEVEAAVELSVEIPRVPMQVTSGCLMASIQMDLTTELLRQFQHDLLERIKATGVSGVILDVSGVQIMDRDDFELLRRTIAMASIMGTRPLVVGLRPGIVAALIELDGNIDGVEAASDLDDALRRLQPVESAAAQTAPQTTDNPDPQTLESPDEGTDRSNSDQY